ncbi:glycosyltransferase [Acinetobacter sp. NCu2D-2]|uniref:glycosyltransferase n=1 Tax=Acinetobacter sp. NCu2D-2 TaxID=1608473 RepID=UPI000AE1BB8D|nr:glycosyltransferase [Acinetobacter sp. NCu2D-2]
MKHLGVVIPACNEEQYIEACIEALTKATQYHQSLSLSQDSISFKIEILVVLDHCTDKTQTILERLDINFLVCDFQCVGKTRDLGIQHHITRF